jgi:hypothetical protein
MRSPCFPVSVKGVVLTASGVVLLRNERDEWELPGGKLEPGESPAACLVREIEEAFLDPIRREAGLAGRDGHAGSIETSTMLAVAEDLVRTDRIPALPARPRLSRFRVLADPGAEFPSGVRGDTTKVSRELGERTVRHIVTEVAELLARLDRGGAE